MKTRIFLDTNIVIDIIGDRQPFAYRLQIF